MEDIDLKEWTRLEDNFSRDVYEDDYSHAVQHSFGRGSFRSIAEKVVVPKIVLDRIILGEGNNSCWTECPRGHRVWMGGAASTRMGGVDTSSLKPKSSGRARALHLRAEKASQVRRRRPRQMTPSFPPLGGHPDIPMQAPPSPSPPYPYPPGATLDDGEWSPIKELVEEDLGGACYHGDSSICAASRGGPGDVAYPHTTPYPDFHGDDIGCGQSVDSFNNEEDLLDIPSAEDLLRTCPEVALPRQPEARGDGLDWSLDSNTLYFSNLPDSITIKELEQHVEQFGKISHSKLISINQAYLRMEKKSSCEWVISCFHGNPFENSLDKLICRYAP